jgi:hypothetical protein
MSWTLITNYGLVLAYIAKHPNNTIRQVAGAISLTEWTVHKIIGELESTGYIEREKLGRNNVYIIDPNRVLRHASVGDIRVGDLLKVLGWEPEKVPDQSA